MVRRIVALAALAALTALLLLSCKDEGPGGAGADGGKAPKLICKVNDQCLICPDDASLKKCIINPTTSGCKIATSGECSP
jgi:hypothetical protein